MAEDTSALGSALIIPDSLLNKIKEADEKLQSLQKTAEKTANGILNSFGEVVGGAGKLYEALDAIETKFGSVNAVAGKMPKKIISTDAIIKAAESIDRLSASTKRGFKELFNQEKIITAAAIILSEKKVQAEEKVKQAKQATATETAKTTIAEEKAAQTAYKAAALQAKSEQERAKVEQERQRAQQEALKVDKEVVKTRTTEANKVAESIRAITAKTKAEGEATKQKIAAARVVTQEIKLQTQEAKISIEQARLKKAEAQAHLSNAQAAEKEARAQELIARAQQRTNNSNNKTLNYSDLNGVINQYSKANTLEEHKKAIQDLQKARLALVTTDKDYKSNLGKVNAAIIQHSKVLKDAGVNTRNLGDQTSSLAGYLSRLAQRTAVVFSLSTMKGFIEQVAEVRGQFEISQRSLESILQNKTQADEIFNKTVELAVKSPFRIKDLVDYTRQLSAYRIENDKLYDTTKRLADVSAGLGVDMGRLILAYGQVKAAAYLRGSEVRQFTEAGINMYGELQEYFKEVKGEAYTTAQIVDMISKRMVSFKDVEAVFQRLTDKGGLFYNMQEIQAETLQGKISNLLDSFDVMLNEVGKEHQGVFVGVIDFTNSLIKNWKTISTIATQVISAFAVAKLQSMGVFSGIANSLQSAWVGLKAFTAGLYVTFKQNGALSAAADAFKGIGSALSGLKTALSGMTFMAVIQAVWSLYDAYSKHNKEVAEANREYIEARGYLADLEMSYKNIVTNINNASSAQERYNNKTADVAAKRQIIQKLVDTLNKNGFEIEINVAEIDEKDLDNQFNKLTEKYKKFERDILLIKKRISDTKIEWFSDDINENAQDYTDAISEILAHDQEMDETINKVKASYKEIKGAALEYFKVIAAGRKEGESDIDYYQRMYDNLNKLGGLMHAQNPNSEISKTLSSYGQTYTSLFSKANDQLVTFKSQLLQVMGDFKRKGYDKQTIKLLIDRTAADNQWSSYAKEIAYKEFKIPLKFETKSIEEQISWVDLYIADFFKSKKYGINLEANQVLDTTIASDWNKGASEAVNAAREWKSLVTDWQKKAKNTPLFKVSETASLGKLLKGTPYEKRESVSSEIALYYAKQRLENAISAAKNGFGRDPFADENNTNNTNNTDKEQRDILQEKINLLKDMNSKYNEFRKTESDVMALTDTRKYFKEAAQNVGWKVNDIFPDDEAVAKKIRELGKTASDIGKKGGYFRIAADVEIKLDEEKFQKLTDDVNKDVDEAFSELDLYKKLRDSGLSESSIKAMFGDIATSFDEVSERIDDAFNKYTFAAYTKKMGTDKIEKWGQKVIDQYNKDIYDTANVMKKSGDDVSKSYLDKTSKLAEKIKQDTVDTFVTLTKAYKTQLSEQLQLDTWYISERNKIQSNADLQKNPDLQNQYLENLNKQYREKSDANSWKDFQDSDMYIRLFENLEQVSEKALDAMYDKLQSLRSSLKDLDPTQLKAIVDQMKKIDDVRNTRNPFKTFISGLKDMAKYSKQLKAMGGVDKYVQLNKQNDYSKEMLKSLNMQTLELQEQYDLEVKLNGADTDKAKTLKQNLTISKNSVNILKTQVGLTDEQIKKLGTVMSEEEKAKSKFSKSVSDITSIVSSMGQAFSGLMDSLGQSSPQLQNYFNLLDHIGAAVASYYSGNYAGMILGAVGAISDIAQIFSNESGIDKEIERQQRLISSLQHSYENLKEAMDNAFDINRLYQYNQRSKETLEQEMEHYDAMIKAEEGRKDPDKSKIQEWKQTKEDLQKQIKELAETMAEELGGFGSQTNYKSAAEAFAEAWVDAFNEGSDALESLNDKFDEYFNNLIKKQLMQRASAKFIEPIIKAFDDAVAEGSAGNENGLEVTKEEIEQIKKLKDKNLAEFDDYAKTLMEILNVTPTGSSNLSDLQQGIQSVTETTAQALESLLNSMRYYLATQQADVRIIRDTLLERLGTAISSVTQDSSSSPVLIELRLQTTILGDIRDTLSSCVKSGHKQGRNGIKVFMN